MNRARVAMLLREIADELVSEDLPKDATALAVVDNPTEDPPTPPKRPRRIDVAAVEATMRRKGFRLRS